MTRRKILYVDDEEDIREVAQMALELDLDMDVRTAASGPAGIEEATRWQPDLILLDVMMPGMDGPTALARLRDQADTASIPVVFITARTQPQDVQRLEAMGVCGIIAKPFDPMSLAQVVRSYL